MARLSTFLEDPEYRGAQQWELPGASAQEALTAEAAVWWEAFSACFSAQRDANAAAEALMPALLRAGSEGRCLGG